MHGVLIWLCLSTRFDTGGRRPRAQPASCTAPPGPRPRPPPGIPGDGAKGASSRAACECAPKNPQTCLRAASWSSASAEKITLLSFCAVMAVEIENFFPPNPVSKQLVFAPGWIFPHTPARPRSAAARRCREAPPPRVSSEPGSPPARDEDTRRVDLRVSRVFATAAQPQATPTGAS